MRDIGLVLAGVITGLVLGAGAMRLAIPSRPVVNVEMPAAHVETPCEKYQALSSQLELPLGSGSALPTIYLILVGAPGFDNLRFANIRAAFDACASSIPR
jgi:hypothetical protein